MNATGELVGKPLDLVSELRYVETLKLVQFCSGLRMMRVGNKWLCAENGDRAAFLIADSGIRDTAIFAKLASKMSPKNLAKYGLRFIEERQP